MPIGEQRRNVLLRRRIIRSPILSTLWKIDFSLHRARRHKYILRGKLVQKRGKIPCLPLMQLWLLTSQLRSRLHGQCRFNCLGNGECFWSWDRGQCQTMSINVSVYSLRLKIEVTDIETPQAKFIICGRNEIKLQESVSKLTVLALHPRSHSL